MSVTVRTNRATNPEVAAAGTNWGAVPGTGGTASGARNTGLGYTATVGFWRVAWTVATTAVSGGLSYTQTGLAAATQYSHQIWVRCSKAQTVSLSAQYQDASAVNVGTAFNGPNVTLVANEWAQVKVEAATSGALVDRVVLTCAALAPGTNWADGDTLDGDLVVIETGAVCGGPFSGSTPNGGSTMYAWTGAVDASTSTATLYTPVVTATAFTTYDPCPRVEVTITDLTPTANTVTVWRTADGKRAAVQGGRDRSMLAADSVIDYAAPLARTLTYDIEITAGIGTAAAAIPSNVTVAATQGCVQDPLVPSTAMPVYSEVGPNGELALLESSLKNLEYAAEMSLIPVMGSPDPVGIMGQRFAAKGVPFNMVTEAAQHATDMRELIMSSPLLLVRPLPSWAGALPGTCYVGAETITEKPINEAWGGNIIEWHANGSLLAAPSMNVIVPLWTYGDVQALWTTYQQAQTALTGKTYIQVKKSPTGA